MKLSLVILMLSCLGCGSDGGGGSDDGVGLKDSFVPDAIRSENVAMDAMLPESVTDLPGEDSGGETVASVDTAEVDVALPPLNPKPVVLLLLDTSASMEYTSDPAQEIEGVTPLCHDERQKGLDYDRSRWVVVLEALSGIFDDYWCSYDMRDDDPEREDYMFSWNEDTGMVMIPHVVPHGIQGQGLLDQYGESVKFGVMAFDAKISSEPDAEGGFSYGPDKIWSGYEVNIGARNESAPWGALVVPPLQDDPGLMLESTEQAKEQVIAATPYAGTPISSLLEDALWFFQNDPNVMPYDAETGLGDPAYETRKKIAILLTDGQPTQGENTQGYQFSHKVAQALYQQGVAVHVIGFHLPIGGSAVLDKIATSGGTGEARVVLEPAQLRVELEEIIASVLLAD